MLVSASDVEKVLAAIDRSGNENRAVGFLIEAVKDIQGTIRAIDTKVGILLAALAIPLPSILAALPALRTPRIFFEPASIAGGLAFLAWLIAALVAVRALTGVGNASMHVRAETKPDDVFYAGGEFTFGLLDAFVTRASPQSRRSVEDYALVIPMSADAVNKHLAFEVMSLAYIRDLKIHRQKVAFELAALAIVLGVLSLVV